MAFTDFYTNSSFAAHHRAIKELPREIFNRNLLLSALLFALSAVPFTWDQGTSGSVPSIPGFQKHFQFTSGNSALEIRNFVGIVYVGAGVGAGLSFFLNDTIGRRWAFRVYTMIWILGQIVASTSPTLAGLYAARIISGLGIGGLTVIGPMAIVEIAPAQIRGMLTSWFTVAMNLSATCGAFCVLGVYKNISGGTRLQYRIVWFAPCIFMFLCVLASFFVIESPRWLFLIDRPEEAIQTLTRLRRLPVEHPHMQKEIHEIQEAIREERALNNAGLVGIMKETFLVPSNLRRVQQTLVTYALAQLSGANSITSYFVPILALMGMGGNTAHNIFLSGIYTFAKLCFAILASTFLVDALGRRKSLFVGIFLQMVSDIYIGVYVKFNQKGSVTNGASQGAIAFIFIHGLGYVVGLYILPYVFGGELWPNRIRSFGCAFSQCFHWLFMFAMLYGAPSLLAQTNNWGAFIFFAAWCFLSILYVYLMVPETSGMSMEALEEVFKGSWFNASRSVNKQTSITYIDGEVETVKTPQDTKETKI